MGTDAEAIRAWQEAHAREIFHCVRLQARMTRRGCDQFQKGSRPTSGSANNVTRTELRAVLCHGCPRSKTKTKPAPVGVFRQGMVKGKKGLSLARNQAGFTQEDVADVLGMPVEDYAEYERGRAVPRDLRVVFCNFFGKPWPELESK